MAGCRKRGDLDGFEQIERAAAVVAAEVGLGQEIAAGPGPVGMAEDPAAQVLREVDAANAGRFAGWHPRQGIANGRGDAAGAAASSALHRKTPSVDAEDGLEPNRR